MIQLLRHRKMQVLFPKDVEEFYDKMTNMNMVDDMNKFQQFQTAQAMEKAAENPSGGGSEGIGMGMGFGMANMMMNQQNTPAAPKSTPATPADSSTKATTREEIMVTLNQLGELKSAGILTDEEFDAKKKELLARL